MRRPKDRRGRAAGCAPGTTLWGAGSAGEPESGRSDRQASDHPNATDRRGSLRAVVRRAGWSREIPRPSHDAWRRIAEERQVVCGWHEERVDQRRGFLTERAGWAASGSNRADRWAASGLLTERTGGQRRGLLSERPRDGGPSRSHRGRAKKTPALPVGADRDPTGAERRGPRRCSPPDGGPRRCSPPEAGEDPRTPLRRSAI